MHSLPLFPTSQYKEWNIIQHIANVSGFPLSYPLTEPQNKTNDKQPNSDDNIVLSYLKSRQFLHNIVSFNGLLRISSNIKNIGA